MFALCAVLTCSSASPESCRGVQLVRRARRGLVAGAAAAARRAAAVGRDVVRIPGRIGARLEPRGGTLIRRRLSSGQVLTLPL